MKWDRLLRDLAREQGWSRQKLKSLRGQLLKLPEGERENAVRMMAKVKGEKR